MMVVSSRSLTFLRAFATAAVILSAAAPAAAIPAGLVERDEVGFFDEVLLMDSPAVLSNPPRVQVEAYTYARSFGLGEGITAIASALGGIFDGVDLGDNTANVVNRTRLFFTIPKSGKTVDLNIDGCGPATLQAADNVVDGVSITDVTCANAFTSVQPISAKVDLSNRGMTAKIFPSAPDGFGVISDVDDTIKISEVLDKVALIKNTFVNEPLPVAGMPELYKSLQTSLNNPSFNYVSGSPFQLYNFLHDFVNANYPPGPTHLRNITLNDIPRLLETLLDHNNTLKHKVATIDRLVALYPAKKFLMIGDSTELDPETYAQAFALHPQSVQCIWIRVVDGADNSDARFQAAFAGVPTTKLRLFKDADISGLAAVDVAGGTC